MTMIVPITKFRKNLFKLTEQIARTGEEIEVEKEGQSVFKVVPVKDDPVERAKYVLEHVLPKLGGSWKDMTKAEYYKVYGYRRGKVERDYWKRKRFFW